jgi:hypothetical protein
MKATRRKVRVREKGRQLAHGRNFFFVPNSQLVSGPHEITEEASVDDYCC